MRRQIRTQHKKSKKLKLSLQWQKHGQGGESKERSSHCCCTTASLAVHGMLSAHNMTIMSLRRSLRSEGRPCTYIAAVASTLIRARREQKTQIRHHTRPTPQLPVPSQCSHQTIARSTPSQREFPSSPLRFVEHAVSLPLGEPTCSAVCGMSRGGNSRAEVTYISEAFMLRKKGVSVNRESHVNVPWGQ